MKLKVNIKQCLRFGYILITAFLVFVTAGVLITFLRLPNGLRSFWVQSGSMSPKIPMGSLIFNKPDNQYAINDVITFKSLADINNSNPALTTTHRIIKIENRAKQGTVYITKGDANDGEDWGGVIPGQVLGKVVFHVPLIGYLISFAKTKEGIIFLVIIPATLIILNEFSIIKKEIVTLRIKNKKRAVHV
jgi:signal peptidase